MYACANLLEEVRARQLCSDREMITRGWELLPEAQLGPEGCVLGNKIG